MPKPVCVACGLFYRPKKNSVTVEEGMSKFTGAVRGRKEDWTAYKLWMADLWECDGCGVEIIVGFGTQPVTEHYKPDYKEMVAKLPPRVFVADC